MVVSLCCNASALCYRAEAPELYKGLPRDLHHLDAKYVSIGCSPVSFSDNSVAVLRIICTKNIRAKAKSSSLESLVRHSFQLCRS